MRHFRIVHVQLIKNIPAIEKKREKKLLKYTHALQLPGWVKRRLTREPRTRTLRFFVARKDIFTLKFGLLKFLSPYIELSESKIAQFVFIYLGRDALYDKRKAFKYKSFDLVNFLHLLNNKKICHSKIV